MAVDVHLDLHASPVGSDPILARYMGAPARGGDRAVPNALQNARSPYLLQHKDNPVEWREWSDQTLV